MDDLIQLVKDKGGVDHENSKVIVNAVLEFVADRLPRTYAKSLATELIEMDQGHIPEHGAKSRIERLFDQISDIQEDMQQRLWSSGDDSQEVEGILSEILELLANAEKNDHHCDSIVADDYNIVKRLAQFYKDEKRNSVRVLLIQIFGLMGGLVSECYWELVRSGLPRFLMDTIQHEEDEQVLMFSLFLATVLLANGNLPLADRDILDVDLVKRLLDIVEEDREDQTILNAAINCVLAINLQFSYGEGAQNVVLSALQGHSGSSFGENVLLIFNRGEPESGTNPCLKLLRDMFAYTPTASFFYTNDLRVLIDVALRELRDLPETDKTRNEYLEMVNDLLKNSNYNELKYRSDDMKEILQELADQSDMPPRTRQLSKRVLEDNASIFN